MVSPYCLLMYNQNRVRRVVKSKFSTTKKRKARLQRSGYKCRQNGEQFTANSKPKGLLIEQIKIKIFLDQPIQLAGVKLMYRPNNVITFLCVLSGLKHCTKSTFYALINYLILAENSMLAVHQRGRIILNKCTLPISAPPTIGAISNDNKHSCLDFLSHHFMNF